jgi:hypothetical protein
MITEADVEATRPRLDGVNWIGVASLYRREVLRFVSVASQTIGGPVVITLLYLAVSGVALGRNAPTPGGVPYLSFIAPGLIVMAIALNAFANTSSSLLIAKVQGNFVDLLLAPPGIPSDVCQCSGNPIHRHRLSFDTETVGSGSGTSTKQPPAIPMCPGKKAAFQKSVDPHVAQNQRCWGFLPPMAYSRKLPSRRMICPSPK